MKTRFEAEVDFRKSDNSWLAYYNGIFLFATGEEYLRTIRPETLASYVLAISKIQK